MPALARRLAPGGSALRAAVLRAALRRPDPESHLRTGLAERLGGAAITLHASGREALRVAFAALAERSGRREVAIPAYTCFSVPAAAVAAGLAVRLVDVTPAGGTDPAALEKLPLEGVAAVLVSNLFGVPEPVAELAALARAAGASLVDDAAQALGARSRDGSVGARGDVGVLSFARGKPLSALGGGALAWRSGPVPPEPPPPTPARISAAARALAWNAARRPRVFGLLAALPGTGIGETVYDPGFPRGGIDGASLCLAAALIDSLEADNASRSERARELAAALARRTRFAPLVAAEGAVGVHPRLGVLAPSAAARAAALAELSQFGVSAMYPSTLEAIPGLRPHLVGDTACPGARDFCARILTLPTHEDLSAALREEAVRALERLA